MHYGMRTAKTSTTTEHYRLERCGGLIPTATTTRYCCLRLGTTCSRRSSGMAFLPRTPGRYMLDVRLRRHAQWVTACDVVSTFVIADNCTIASLYPRYHCVHFNASPVRALHAHRCGTT